jgi:hypothetical protein
MLHPYTLQRITNSRLYGNQYSVADMLNDLNAGIFSADLKTNVNVYRQGLQTAYVKMLLNIVTEKYGQYDEIAKGASLNAVKKIKTMMSTAVSPNEETRALRGNIIYLINEGLEKK